MENFKQVLQDCNLHGVPFTIPKFIKSWGRGSNMILERLDKGLVSETWLSMFPVACEKHLTSPIFEHASLLFHVINQQLRVRGNKRSFSF